MIGSTGEATSDDVGRPDRVRESKHIVSHGGIEFWYVNAVSPCSGSNSDHEGEALYNAAKSAATDAVSQGVSCYVATGRAKTRCLRALRDRMRKAVVPPITRGFMAAVCERQLNSLA